MTKKSEPANMLTRVLRDETNSNWEVRYGEVPIGGYRSHEGRSNEFHWLWNVGFYPGMHPGGQRSGRADTEDSARQAFSEAWAELEPNITEEQYEEWRHYARHQIWIRKMHAAGLPLPTTRSDLKSKCFCGVTITAEATDGTAVNTDDHINEAHREVR